MKQIAQTLTHEEALKLKVRIESAGIPVVISGSGASHLFRTGLVSVWVAIDSQYNDALLVLDNPGHIANNPIEVEEFHRAVRQTNLVPELLTKINYPALFTYAAIAGFSIFLFRAVVNA
jgi:hypothetical protein